MTAYQYKEEIEKIFKIRIQRNKNKMTIDESLILGVYYFIGHTRFNFTGLQLAELVDSRIEPRKNGAHMAIKRHWKRVEVSPVYNFIYLKAIMHFFPNENSYVYNESNNVHIRKLLTLDNELINSFCETRLKPFLKMQESKITNKDLIQKQILTRTM